MPPLAPCRAKWYAKSKSASSTSISPFQEGASMRKTAEVTGRSVGGEKRQKEKEREKVAVKFNESL